MESAPICGNAHSTKGYEGSPALLTANGARQLEREEQKEKDTLKSLQNFPSGSLTPNTPTNPEPRASNVRDEAFRIQNKKKWLKEKRKSK